ncbi:GntR family transcriptional regulator [Planctomicrobium piriforme]|uniref:DNA-binding transcriptional regulator, GntR family n=1 Tax=Planctomicrobium piriforme TaxID=1576369 RepID=A0A1I3F130_9PLAN|nr:GntR family transcriptional regulator [Planctomicrobium piriforme]SFI04481.1 DNA-binding transcriptional regulator, GntR family [Planctomicrobium piriforme]
MPAAVLTSDALHHGSRRERLVREILSRCFDGKYLPGQRMRVEHLAEEYQMSATPVREALVELAGIGIVDLHANRGAVLRPFGAREVREIVQVRRVLECEATRSACGRIPLSELEDLRLGLEELIAGSRGEEWSAQTRRLDSQLHELIARHCGSERLAYEIGRYSVLYRVLRDTRHERRTARANYSQMEENAEHLAIVNALIAGNHAVAVASMAEHINQSAAALTADLFDAPASSESPPTQRLQTVACPGAHRGSNTRLED